MAYFLRGTSNVIQMALRIGIAQLQHVQGRAHFKLVWILLLYPKKLQIRNIIYKSPDWGDL